MIGLEFVYVRGLLRISECVIMSVRATLAAGCPVKASAGIYVSWRVQQLLMPRWRWWSCLACGLTVVLPIPFIKEKQLVGLVGLHVALPSSCQLCVLFDMYASLVLLCL